MQGMQSVGWWRLNDYNNTATDSSSHHHDGTYHNNPEHGYPGIIGDGFTDPYDFAHQYVEVPDHDDFS